MMADDHECGDQEGQRESTRKRNSSNVLAAANAASAAAAKRKEQERDTRYTRASICMVIVFLTCHVPRFASNVFELVQGENVRHATVRTSSSLSFYTILQCDALLAFAPPSCLRRASHCH